ncbi:antibiotic biosynthesis monooxygenase [Kribbella sp. NBC_01505]|uniref:putative quinol monooxygenase n=1 Tax=Kribbella sp. NBC_01505 TaxID=2903580 RepID=UPI0038699B0A
MYGGLARFVVKPGKREEFLEVLRWSARVARDDEPGTLRLDVWEVEDEPGVIYGYEAYTSREAFELHIKNPAVQRFGEIGDTLVEGWTFVIPFTETLTSTAD